jgi:hypothetical protein
MIEASVDMPVRTERGRTARRAVVDGFDWLRIAERVNGIYREILT